MFNLIKNTILLFSLSLAISSGANANTVSVVTSSIANIPYTQTGKLAQKVGSKNGYYSAQWGPSATSVWTTLDANGDIGNQGTGNSNLSTWITNTSGYSGALTLVSSVDSLGGGSTGAFDFGNKSANYVAVHYGQAESLFYFKNGITDFDLNFVEGNFGLSNYRAYSNESPSAVPVPAALPLMASALGIFGLARRRNKSKAA